jgi:hypothetical protein
MAYAEFAGKSIPTVYEWRQAAPIGFNAAIVLMSNFDGKAPAPVRSHFGMSNFGAYDMAGKKEWTANASGTFRYALGARDEPSYVFSTAARRPFPEDDLRKIPHVNVPMPPAASFAPRAQGGAEREAVKRSGYELLRASIAISRRSRARVDRQRLPPY